MQRIVIFRREMMEQLLPAATVKLRRKIALLAQNYSLVKPEASCSIKNLQLSDKTHPEILKLISELWLKKAVKTDKLTSIKPFSEFIWALEQVASHYPYLALQLNVHHFLFLRLIYSSQEKKSWPPEEFLDPASGAYPTGNHVYLPTGVINQYSAIYPGFSRSSAGPGRTSDKPIYVFFNPSTSFLLLPGRESEQQPGLFYFYLLEPNELEVETKSFRPDCFPLRPMPVRVKNWTPEAKTGDKVLTLEVEEIKKVLVGFNLGLVACFSGWLRATLKFLVGMKLPSSNEEKLDWEINYLTTEVHKMQFLLYRLTTCGLGQLLDRSGALEKLARNGLHLASRAWRFLKVKNSSNFF